jgi:hypothetical protein
MNENEVFNMFLARRDNYGVSDIQHVAGHKYDITMKGKGYHMVVLPNSFQFYEKRYHIAKTMPSLVICFCHDTVLPVACLSMEDSHLAQPLALPARITSMDKQRHKSKAGSQVVLGGFMAGNREAVELVDSLPERTRRRYHERAKELGKRRRGRPVSIASC